MDTVRYRTFGLWIYVGGGGSRGFQLTVQRINMMQMKWTVMTKLHNTSCARSVETGLTISDLAGNFDQIDLLGSSGWGMARPRGAHATLFHNPFPSPSHSLSLSLRAFSVLQNNITVLVLTTMYDDDQQQSVFHIISDIQPPCNWRELKCILL